MIELFHDLAILEMTNQDINQLKSWFNGFARLYFQSGHPDLSPQDLQLIEREMNRLANCIVASLPVIPTQAILIPHINETYAISIDPAWHEFPPHCRHEAFIVVPCISLKAAVQPMELVG